MVGAQEVGQDGGLVMSLVVDTVSQRHPWGIKGRSPGGCVYRPGAWGGGLSWVGSFLPSFPSTPALWLWFSALVSLLSFDCGQAARIRIHEGTWCRPRGRQRRSVRGQRGTQQLDDVELVELLAWVCS